MILACNNCMPRLPRMCERAADAAHSTRFARPKLAPFNSAALSQEADISRLRSLPAFHHVHGHALAFDEFGDTGTVQCGGVNKDVLAAAVANDEAEAFGRRVELH